MRILMLGKLAVDTSDVPLFIKKAFEELGHQVTMVCPDEDPTILESVLLNTQRRFTWLDLWAFSKRVLKKIKHAPPDMLLVFGSNFYVLPSLLRMIKKKLPTKIVLWEGNIQFWRWFQSEALQYYDYCFVVDSHLKPVLAGPALKTHVLQLGPCCDPEEHFPRDLSTRDIEEYGSEVSFVGSGFPNRTELFENLAEFDLKLWGRYWDRSPRLVPHFIDEPVYGIRKCKIYKASKILINLQNPVTQINGVSCRIFEILACGGFPLTENKKDLSLYFNVGKEIVAFDGMDDLKKKTRYYLDHPDERAEIARRGRERVLSEHTYKHRIERMLGIINTC